MDEEFDVVVVGTGFGGPIACSEDICRSGIKDTYNRTNKKIWKVCLENYLIHEIDLINPKLIIFQGNTAYNYLRKILLEKNKKYSFIVK